MWKRTIWRSWKVWQIFTTWQGWSSSSSSKPSFFCWLSMHLGTMQYHTIPFITMQLQYNDHPPGSWKTLSLMLDGTPRWQHWLRWELGTWYFIWQLKIIFQRDKESKEREGRKHELKVLFEGSSLAKRWKDYLLCCKGTTVSFRKTLLRLVEHLDEVHLNWIENI